MRKFLTASVTVCTTAVVVFAATVGSGTPSVQIQQSFQNAFARGTFSTLVNLPPVGDVRTLTGTTGLVQEFTSKTNVSLKLALIKPDPAAPPSLTDTLQVYSDLYAAYLSAGISTAGFPLNSTTACPPGGNGFVCNYQLFAKNYALFVYSYPGTATVSVTDPVFTRWSNENGVNGSLGPAQSPAATVVSSAKTSGTQQFFAGGVIYSYVPVSGTAVTYVVSGPVYQTFSGYGAGVLGFPTTEEITFASGLHRQLFQGGRIEYTPGGAAVVLFPLTQLYISGASAGLNLKAGATAQLSAVAVDSLGNLAPGRALNWSSSDGSVATVQGNGDSAVVKAVGSGQARIVVTGEGITSAPISISAGGVCCGIGEGAPTPAITQAFQAAVVRNHLVVALPNETAVVSAGSGYVQFLSDIAVSQSGSSALAYVSRSSVYAAYLANGGFTGPLGYPASDVSAGGTQVYTGGAALAGSPVRLIPAGIAAKWLLTGAETGFLGPPAGISTSFTSLTGVAGITQTFAGGAIFSGAQSGARAYSSTGLILARYLALGGPAGLPGVPLGDIGLRGGVPSQDFEAGYIDLQTGASAAAEHFNARVPSVRVTPSTVGPRGRVHVSIAGFAPGSTLTVGITGQPGFVVAAPGGGFNWDITIPASAQPGITTVQVRPATGSDSATGAFTVNSLPQLQPRLLLVSGDQQTGVPGGALASPVVATLQDSSGNPLPGVSVTYSVSPGASAILPAVTDAGGRISGTFRLPLTTGVAVLSVTAANQVVSFSALAAAKTITNFPVVTASSLRASVVAALAAIIQYHQNAGALGVPNGLATPSVLNDYLLGNSGFGVSDSGAALANPWAAARFAGGTISVEMATVDSIHDLLNAGSPVLVLLKLTVDGTVTGTVAVNAIGVNGDGSIAIVDPNPAYGASLLSNYLDGFAGIRGTLTGAIRILPGPATPGGFVFSSPLSAAGSAASPSGDCGAALDLLDGAGTGVRFIPCDGTQSAYQLAFGAPGAGGTPKGSAVFDSGTGISQQLSIVGGNAFLVTRSGSASVIAPQATAITAVVNAANVTAGISPGGIFSIFGYGFTVGSVVPQVSVGGIPVPVLAAFPFQVNAQLPSAGFSGGSAVLQVAGPLKSATITVQIVDSAPGIFVIGAAADGRGLGAIINQDGTINGSATPALRGQFISVYGTGLGATITKGGLQVTTAAVTVLLNGTSLVPSFAGLSPGTAGLYQVNVQIPASSVPGLGNLTILESGQSSNSVAVAIQ